MKPYYQSDLLTLYLGDTLDVLPHIETGSVNAIISDPPYPMIKRAYGTLTELQWSILMTEVCHQSRRVLTDNGSAVFVLQPNSRKVGSMRGWLFEFQAWVCREWNMVQDVWWWNFTTPPVMQASRRFGLMRPSIRGCIWCGPFDCHRNQDVILWQESDYLKVERLKKRSDHIYSNSGYSTNRYRAAIRAEERGGVTPFNVLLFSNTSNADGHTASTPLPLADWWTRYICPPDSVILDPFVGAGTMMLAGLLHGHRVIGIDKEREYLDITIKRCESLEKQRRGEWHIERRKGKKATMMDGQLDLFQTIEEALP